MSDVTVRNRFDNSLLNGVVSSWLTGLVVSRIVSWTVPVLFAFEEFYFGISSFEKEGNHSGL